MADDFVEAAMSKLMDAGYAAMAAGGLDVVSDIRRSLAPDPNASRPGDAPNSKSGRLARGIQYDVDADPATAEVTLNVDSTAPYSRKLEYGDGRTEARPFMGPALERMAVSLPARVAQVMADELAR